MSQYWLKVRLESDATFGRGDGVAGLVDTEVQHDENGLPYIGGRILKGLLGAECADILFALQKASSDMGASWRKVEMRLFGDTGSLLTGEASLRIGPARLPDDLRGAIAYDVQSRKLTRGEVLETFTVVRRQTAMDAGGAPKKETLRSSRVLIRKLEFIASLDFSTLPSDQELALLAASVKALRRVGSSRNRGLGRIHAELLDESLQAITDQYFDHFRKAVLL